MFAEVYDISLLIYIIVLCKFISYLKSAYILYAFSLKRREKILCPTCSNDQKVLAWYVAYEVFKLCSPLQSKGTY